jgi:MFS transporter, DHA2 family, multidrug resistance protein
MSAPAPSALPQAVSQGSFAPAARPASVQTRPLAAAPINPWIIALTVTLATFMEVLDTSVANVALPHIAGSLSAGQDESTWVLTSYLVSNAIVLPISGWISSMIGRKRFYMTCVALFTVSSFLCGLAPSLGALIFFRVLQGAGGGGLQPSEQAILADTFPPSQRGMAFAVYGMAVVLAPAIGPALGGWITDNFNWRWIFFINIPVGLLSLFLTNMLISDPDYLKREVRKFFRVDYLGLGLLAVGLGALQVVLDKGQRDDWFGSRFIVGMTIVCVSALVAVTIWEWFHKDPIIDLHLFKERSFAIGNLMIFMVGFALLSSTVLLPQMLQGLMGYTAEKAGLVLMPGGFALLIVIPFVGYLLGKYDARWLLLIGLSVLAFAMFHMTRFDTLIDFRTAAAARVIQTCGLAFLFIPINTAAYAFLPREKNNAASGLINLSRNIGGSVGISVVTTMLARRAQYHETVLASQVQSGSGPLRSLLDSATRAFIAHGSSPHDALRQAYALVSSQIDQQSAMLAYVDNFWLVGVLVLAMIPFVFLMKKVKPGGPIAVH